MIGSAYQRTVYDYAELNNSEERDDLLGTSHNTGSPPGGSHGFDARDIWISRYWLNLGRKLMRAALGSYAQPAAQYRPDNEKQ
jgi:hypothetical protein